MFRNRILFSTVLGSSLPLRRRFHSQASTVRVGSCRNFSPNSVEQLSFSLEALKLSSRAPEPLMLPTNISNTKTFDLPSGRIGWAPNGLMVPSNVEEKIYSDPLPDLLPLRLPPVPHRAPEMRAGLHDIQRRRRINKHKRNKRIRKFGHEIEKQKKRKELRMEKAFRDELDAMIKEGLKFDAAEYVNKILKYAHSQETTQKYRYDYEYFKTYQKHWTELMTIEQLYGVPDSNFIDKKLGFVEEEDWEEIQKQRKKYLEEYKKELKKEPEDNK